MTATLTAKCPICGLRFTNRALLELHLREDHRKAPPAAARDGTDQRRRNSPVTGHSAPPATP